MLEIKKRYVVDEQDHRIAVQIDLETFAPIEEALEDLALSRWIGEAQDEPAFGLEAARERYDSLDKALRESLTGTDARDDDRVLRHALLLVDAVD